MRIIVYPHAMEIGGSQLNAVQLAGAVRDRGHDVLVLSEPGPLVDHVRALGLEHIAIPERRRRPSVGVIGTLNRLVAERAVDVVHGYEWPPAVEAFFGPRLRHGTAAVATVMSASVVPFFPRWLPLLVGTEQIREAARAAGHARVTLLEPPVDTELDRPGTTGPAFRARHGLAADLPLVAIVCRLVADLKRESLLAACAAIGELATRGRPVQLVVVGDGPVRAEVAERAERANAVAGRRLVVLTGELADPRPAYDAADIVLGMGGSALRGMAFGKPLVVVGEQGFSELLTPDTAPRFLAEGWYGLGAGSRGTGVPALRLAIEHLLDQPELGRDLGHYARELVVRRFSLTRAGALQEQEYAVARELSARPGTLLTDAARSATGLLGYKIRRRVDRRRGRAAVDDANSRPLVTASRA